MSWTKQNVIIEISVSNRSPTISKLSSYTEQFSNSLYKVSSHSFVTSPSFNQYSKSDLLQKLWVTEKALKEMTSKYINLNTEFDKIKAKCIKMEKEKTKNELSLKTQVKTFISKLSKSKKKLLNNESLDYSKGKFNKTYTHLNTILKGNMKNTRSRNLSTENYKLLKSEGNIKYSSTKKHLSNKGRVSCLGVELRDPKRNIMSTISLNSTIVPNNVKYKTTANY